ncbi:MAG TPA: class I SAM-dependent methyltransferase [Bacilli bacterium]|nr:class I SAM-dependent methyltransferase [Bacilli bacterium]
MENKNMTALISCFARAYHSNYKFKIFNDSLARKIITDEEYNNISKYMVEGIGYFNKNIKGTKEQILRYIVDNNLSPSVLGRSIYCEKMLKQDIKLGLKQYLIFASGYDTYAYRNQNNIKVFEIDTKEMIADKLKRLELADIRNDNVTYIKTDLSKDNFINDILDSDFDKTKKSFCSLLGISYYLNKEEFTLMINNISKLLCDGSTLVIDYPTIDKDITEIKKEELAKEAKEEMKATYTFKEIEKIFNDCGMLVYENLDNNDINNNYFYNYNTLNPSNRIYAPKGVNYCLVVKK